jgi:FAD/FMN-containing dehydrogenases
VASADPVAALIRRLGPGGVLTDPAEISPYLIDLPKRHHGAAPAVRVKPEAEIDLMRRLKRALDPEDRMNSGKIVEA